MSTVYKCDKCSKCIEGTEKRYDLHVFASPVASVIPSALKNLCADCYNDIFKAVSNG